MAALIAGSAVVLYLMYKYRPEFRIFTSETVSDWIGDRIDNGDSYRFETFGTMQGYLSHPDVLNNSLFEDPDHADDLGTFGVRRHNVQLQKGISPIIQIYNTDNLVV